MVSTCGAARQHLDAVQQELAETREASQSLAATARQRARELDERREALSRTEELAVQVRAVPARARPPTRGPAQQPAGARSAAGRVGSTCSVGKSSGRQAPARGSLSTAAVWCGVLQIGSREEAAAARAELTEGLRAAREDFDDATLDKWFQPKVRHVVPAAPGERRLSSGISFCLIGPAGWIWECCRAPLPSACLPAPPHIPPLH